MISFSAVVLVVAALCVSSTDAIGPCSDTIIQGLSKYSECYDNGKPPSLWSSGSLVTFTVFTKDDKPRGECVTGIQDKCSGKAFVTLHLPQSFNVTFDQVDKGNYIEETDDKGVKYRIYVIYNENKVYSYYRCTESKNGVGSPMAAIAVGCKYLKKSKTIKDVEKAKACFKKLGIKSFVDVTPCKC